MRADGVTDLNTYLLQQNISLLLVTCIQDEVTEEPFERWTPSSKQAISSEPMRVPRAVIVPSLALPLLLIASCAVFIVVLISCCLASQRRREEAAQERNMSKPRLCFIHLSGVGPRMKKLILWHMFAPNKTYGLTKVPFGEGQGRAYPWFNPELTRAWEARLVT